LLLVCWYIIVHIFCSRRCFFDSFFDFDFKEDDNFGVVVFSFIPYLVVVKTQKAFVEFFLAISIFQLVRQPVEAFVESIPRGGTGRLNVPIPVSQRMKS